jgi:GT2 family glycosyltransferase
LIKTSIIIPSFNEKSLLKDCLYSIKKYTETPYEVIVIDNGSTDGTSDVCITEQIPFISISQNKGFPEACNLGLKMASGDTLLLLNNDVLVTPHWLTNMLHCLYSSEDIGIVGPLTNYASGKQQIQVSYTDLYEMAEQFNQANPDKWQQTDRIVGLCFLFKRKLLDQIGGLDERFSPGHYEDDDYCYRARNAGYRLMIAGDVFIHHHGSMSFGRRETSEFKQLIENNRLKFIEKWGVDPQIFI